MPRLFTAVPLPEHVSDRLARFKAPLPGARWLEPSDYHLTLRFAGDLDNSLANEFTDALSRIRLDGFEVRLSGFGIFGGHDPRTLWIGVAPSPGLNALHRANETAARAAGLPPERRQFKPHVTLARLSGTRLDAITRYLAQHAAVESPPFFVDRFQLLSSKPRTGGGPYVVEDEYFLAGHVWQGHEEDGSYL